MTIRFPLGRRPDPRMARPMARPRGSRLAAVAALAVLTAAAAFATPANEAPPDYPALSQPSRLTPKAAGATMLGLATAGRRLVAVGERGIVLLSDDQGGTWRQAHVPVGASLTAVRFVDERTGWAVGHFGTVLRTEDGGESWTRQLDGIEAARLAEQAALRMVQQGLPETAPAADRLLASSRQLVEEGPDKPFLDLLFRSAEEGIVVGAFGLILRTRDGGRSWTSATLEAPNPDGLHIYAVGQGGADLYLVGEQGLVLRSGDGGDSFRRLATPYRGSFFAVAADAAGGVVLAGLRGNAVRSTDHGASWEAAGLPVAASVTAVARGSGGRLLFANQAGQVLASDDFGRSAAPLPLGPLPPLTGLAVLKDGGLLAATPLGLRRLPPSGLASPGPASPGLVSPGPAAAKP